MSTKTVGAFEAALDRLDVDWTHATRSDFASTIAAVVESPAVGVELPFEGVSLAETPVDVDPTPARLEGARTGVTAARMGIADYGSVVLESTPEGGEPVGLYAERHVAVLRREDVVPGMREAFARFGPWLREGRDSAVIATGPSATADMGGLVKGAHGPKEVHVVILDE
ncbi:lactate utilization protein C [Halomarina halobia]|uniref:Lactate utilization protein C n=1 Tax=Halomarina halobia TaxID=3033386 RepID=A0ABD6AB69_9EURY|nr:LUD domain-containing protein [Halomarina sp. PSR21]